MKSRPSLATLRRQMLLPTDGTILLNAGTMSPTPRPVMAAAAFIREEQASNPHRFFFERHGQYIGEARSALAGHLRVLPADLFLFPNVTIGLNHVIHAIDAAVRERRSRRDTVLVSSLEYGSITLAWRNSSSLKIEIVPIHACATWDEIVETFRRHITTRTAALCVSHVAQPTGRVLPVAALCELARSRGVWSVIDGAHAPGLLPLDLDAIGADAYGANLHKWMMGLANSGFICVSKAMKDLLRPMLVSWGAKDLTPANRDSIAPFYGGTQLQGAMEFWGCVDRVPQMVIPDTLDFLGLVDPTRMRKRTAELSTYATDALSVYFEPVMTDDPERVDALRAFRLPTTDRHAFRRWMWRRKIAIGATRLREDVEGLPGDPDDPAAREVYLRVSTAWFNQESEIDALAHACRAWLKTVHGGR